jgi:hypothetical protein
MGTTGIRQRGCGSANGTICDSAVDSVAAQDAGAVTDAAFGVHVTALPKLLAPFLNCTIPVGPAPLLVVFTIAVSVTFAPAVILVGLGVTTVVVVACVMVTDSVFDELVA